ncbi:MAG: hypothetical protein IJ658_02160 [Kiritimatiellae bacterium]|nr:hypothetical protein [Kiritimatiellia bacterium]
MRVPHLAALAAACAAASGAAAFEKIAIIDSFDFAAVYDTETVAGTDQVLDHVLLTGADTVLWRNCSGSTMRYLSAEEPSALMEAPLDPRRVPESRQIYGWLRYWAVEPDIVRTAFASCARRGVAQGIHWPYEENHWNYWTLGAWNLSHPQYWCRNANGVPWHGRSSFAFPEVLAHKLRLLDELLDRSPQTIFLDLFRCGGWTVADEYVKPHLDRWRERCGEPPPDSRDPRWIALVGETQEAFFRAVRARIAERGMKVRVLLGIDRVSAGADENWTKHAVDWKKLAREDVVDGIVIESVRPDPERPFASTAEIYASVREALCGKPFFCPIMQYNFGGRPGYPWYCKATGAREEETVRQLLEIARDAGAAGIAMECVDYKNYSPAVCEAIRDFGGKGEKKGKGK